MIFGYGNWKDISNYIGYGKDDISTEKHFKTIFKNFSIKMKKDKKNFKTIIDKKLDQLQDCI